jgi:hypothetical protein
MIGIIGYAFLLCAVIIGILLALSLIFYLFAEYPIRINLIIVIFLLVLGVPIFYIPVIYFIVITSICMIVAIIFWISSICESKNAVKQLESFSEEEVEIDVENNNIIKITTTNSFIVVEDLNVYDKVIYKPISQKITIGSEKGSFGYTNRREGRRSRGKNHARPISSSSWFCRSQLFYDGYSEGDALSYEEYLEYMDLKDYYSYYEH